MIAIPTVKAQRALDQYLPRYSPLEELGRPICLLRPLNRKTLQKEMLAFKISTKRKREGFAVPTFPRLHSPGIESQS